MGPFYELESSSPAAALGPDDSITHMHRTIHMQGTEKDLDAVAQAVQFLSEQLENIPWEGTVVLVKPDKMVINRGSREGVTEGMTFEVGSIEELVDPDTGEVLDVELTRVAILKVTKVKEKISYCKAVDGGSKVAKGMSVFPANR